ncbi:hypothetical protein [Photobacterium sp. 1_MG-2023]|uniref:hypothetical protein n=1 Tax=Photobacterium sp. 1_MG-2023 TaxID=3062646 RepID=UPI0026E2F540|nr:hypothetical protein [Photobacterium sp. 1_MG-2023]MDO6705117.1 hypothetical protein [Photobacterium sp. 1_MG-2023]
MLNAITLTFMSVFLTVIGVCTLGITTDELPVLAVAMPALWLLPQGGLSAVLLLGGVGLYCAVLPHQPLALSVSLLMMFPVFSVSFSSKANWQVGALLFAVVIAMDAGLLALQSEGKLSGHMSDTLLQVLAVGMIWCAGRFWRPVQGNYGWPLLFALPLWLGGLAPSALIVLCIIGLIMAFQTLCQIQPQVWVTRLSWILPAIAFATVVLLPEFEVPNPVLVSWLMVLGSAILGEYLMAEAEET